MRLRLTTSLAERGEPTRWALTGPSIPHPGHGHSGSDAVSDEFNRALVAQDHKVLTVVVFGPVQRTTEASKWRRTRSTVCDHSTWADTDNSLCTIGALLPSRDEGGEPGAVTG